MNQNTLRKCVSFEEMCFLCSHLTTVFPGPVSVDGIRSLPINTEPVYIISPVFQVSLPKHSGVIQQPQHIVRSRTILRVSSVGRTPLGRSFLPRDADRDHSRALGSWVCRPRGPTAMSRALLWVPGKRSSSEVSQLKLQHVTSPAW